MGSGDAGRWERKLHFWKLRYPSRNGRSNTPGEHPKPDSPALHALGDQVHNVLPRRLLVLTLGIPLKHAGAGKKDLEGLLQRRSHLASPEAPHQEVGGVTRTGYEVQQTWSSQSSASHHCAILDKNLFPLRNGATTVPATQRGREDAQGQRQETWRTKSVISC